MFKNLLFLFGLFTVLAASAAPKTIRITSAPFTITAPGTYVLGRDITGSNFVPAITISTGLSGSVVLDLKGHTIDAGAYYGVQVGTGGSNSFPITIRNGTIDNFYVGIVTNAALTNITVSNITFNYNGFAADGVSFSGVGNSAIINCTFNGVFNPPPGSGFVAGILDGTSPGGNTYSGCRFTNVLHPIVVLGVVGGSIGGLNTPTSLNSCQFQ